MPIVQLHVLEGYTKDDKQRLGEALTDAVRLVVPATPELVTVMISDMPARIITAAAHRERQHQLSLIPRAWCARF